MRRLANAVTERYPSSPVTMRMSKRNAAELLSGGVSSGLKKKQNPHTLRRSQGEVTNNPNLADWKLSKLFYLLLCRAGCGSVCPGSAAKPRRLEHLRCAETAVRLACGRSDMGECMHATFVAICTICTSGCAESAYPEILVRHLQIIGFALFQIWVARFEKKSGPWLQNNKGHRGSGEQCYM